MKLDRFSYYFSVKGNEGGIFSMTFGFLSDDAGLSPLDTLKKRVKNDFEQLESMLDFQFLTNTHIREGKKIPTLTDSPASLETGFEYKSNNKKIVQTTSKTFFGAFSSIFFPNSLRQEKIDKPVLDSFMTLSASLCCRMNKGRENQASPVLGLEIQAGHDLNLQMFDTILSLPGLSMSSQAEAEIRNLRQILATGKQIDPKKYLELEG